MLQLDCVCCGCLQAERVQQSQDKMVRERQARLSVAESNMQLLVARMEEEAAQAAQHSRFAP